MAALSLSTSLTPTLRAVGASKGNHNARSCRKLHTCRTVCSDQPRQEKNLASTLSKSTAAALAAAALTLSPSPAMADNELVGKWNASGLIFKDSVEVLSFEDPKIDGVTLYISEFQRSLSAKLQKDFFSEPSQASLTCAQTAKIAPKVDLASLPSDGEEVYSERKNLSLATKTLRVRRLYDADHDTLVYVSYSTRLSSTKDDGSSVSSQYKTSICTIPLYNSKPAPPLSKVVEEVKVAIEGEARTP